jgi:hypothetical protein
MRSAVVGALVAGSLWQFAQWCYVTFVIKMVQYSAFYELFPQLLQILGNAQKEGSSLFAGNCAELSEAFGGKLYRLIDFAFRRRKESRRKNFTCRRIEALEHFAELSPAMVSDDRLAR